jgi:hypothetical protein
VRQTPAERLYLAPLEEGGAGSGGPSPPKGARGELVQVFYIFSQGAREKELEI